MTLKPLKAPKDALGVKLYERAVKNALNAIATAAKADFRVTTRTWKTKPEFTIDASKPDRRIVGTDDQIYKYVNDGTRPHLIRPHGRVLTWLGTNYRAKTTPNVIGSKGSANNNTIVYTKLVQHPGNTARNFTVVIRDKWAKEMKTRMQAALVAAGVKKAGKVNNTVGKPTAEWDWGQEG